jgi:hypothetical protein
MYVVLSKVEKHVSYEELVGTTECITLYPRCRNNRGRYNRVELYFSTGHMTHIKRLKFPV